jgi:PRC-barrel domain
MSHYGTLRDYRFEGKDADDIRGSDLYGRNDEDLGEIVDVIFDHGTGYIRYIVVDTGGWLSSNKFIVPAERLEPSAEHEDDFQVNLSKDEVKNFPAYNEDVVNDRDRWRDYESRYNAAWTTEGGVLHRADAPDRIITPPDHEISSATAASSRPQPVAASGADLGGSIGTQPPQESRLGQRWNRFEDRLRTDRNRLTHDCEVCGTGPSSVRDVERERKVG